MNIATYDLVGIFMSCTCVHVYLLQFLAIMTGLNKANATYACIWCTVSKDKRYILEYHIVGHVNMYRTTNGYVHTTCTPYRWDMSVHEDMYNKSPPSGKARTLASLHRNCCFSKLEKHLGSRHPPLIELEPSSYVMDELHLLLRVADVLVRNLIHLADQLDQRQQQRDGSPGTRIHTLQDLVKSCSVPFRISRVRDRNLTHCTKMCIHIYIYIYIYLHVQCTGP